MADISYGISLNVNKEFLSSRVDASSVTANMSNVGLKSVTYTLTTNAVSISTANLSAVGIAFVRNLSTATSSTAQIGITAGGSFAPFTTIKAGEPQLFRLTTGTEYQAVGVAGTRLRVDILEG
jgi:hypothetical protein